MFPIRNNYITPLIIFKFSFTCRRPTIKVPAVLFSVNEFAVTANTSMNFDLDILLSNSTRRSKLLHNYQKTYMLFKNCAEIAARIQMSKNVSNK